MKKVKKFVVRLGICFLLLPAFSAAQTAESLRLVVNSGHSASAQDLKFSPDGKYFATIAGAAVIVWESETGREVRRFELDGATEEGRIVFNPAGDLLAGDGKQGIRIWEWRSGKLVQTLDEYSNPLFSPSGKFLVAVRYGEIKLLDAKTFDTLAALSPADDSHATRTALRADEKMLASIHEGAVKLWNLERRVEERISLKHQTGEITVAAFSPDGKTLATSGTDGTVRIWDAASGVELHRMKMPARGDSENDYYALVFNRDGSRLATGSLYGAQIWNVAEGSLEREYEAGDFPRTNAVAFSPDEKMLVGVQLGGALRFWETATGAMLRKIEFSGKDVDTLAVAPDGSKLAADLSSTFLWNLKTGAVEIVSGSANSLSFSADGRILARGDYSGVDLLDPVSAQPIATGAPEKIGKIMGKSTGVAAISPDGKLIAVSGDSFKAAPTILYDAATGAKIREFEGHGGSTEALAFSPNGKLLASAGGTTIKITEVATGKVLQNTKLTGSYPLAKAVAFNPAGDLLAGGGFDDTVSLWRTADGGLTRALKAGQNVNSIAFSANGKTVAAALDNGKVCIWNVADGASLQVIAAHTGDAEAVAFHPNNKFLFTSGDDERIKIWDAANGKLLATIMALDRRDWVVFAPDNRFDSSSGANEYLHWVTGLKIEPLSAHAARFRTPGLLAKILVQ